MSAHTPWHESIDEEADELYIVNSRGATIAEMIRGINAREEAAGIIKAVNRDHHFDALVKALEAVADARMPGEARRIAVEALRANQLSQESV